MYKSIYTIDYKTLINITPSSSKESEVLNDNFLSENNKFCHTLLKSNAFTAV